MKISFLVIKIMDGYVTLYQVKCHIKGNTRSNHHLSNKLGKLYNIGIPEHYDAITEEKSNGIPPDTERAVMFYQQAISSGFYSAILELSSIFHWGNVGFTVRIKHNNRWKSLIEAYPTCTNIFTDKWARKKSLPIEICKKFQRNVSDIPAANRIIIANRVYLYYRKGEMNLGEFNKLMKEIDTTLQELIKHFNTT